MFSFYCLVVFENFCFRAYLVEHMYNARLYINSTILFALNQCILTEISNLQLPYDSFLNTIANFVLSISFKCCQFRLPFDAIYMILNLYLPNFERCVTTNILSCVWLTWSISLQMQSMGCRCPLWQLLNVRALATPLVSTSLIWPMLAPMWLAFTLTNVKYIFLNGCYSQLRFSYILQYFIYYVVQHIWLFTFPHFYYWFFETKSLLHISSRFLRH